MRSSNVRYLLAVGCLCVAACSQKDSGTGGTAGTAAAGEGAAGGGSATAGTGNAGTDGAGTGSAGTSSAGTGAADSGTPDTDAAVSDGAVGPAPEDFFPLVDGATFTFRHFNPSAAAWDDTATLSTTTYKGSAAFLSTGSANPKGETSENILVVSGTKVHRTSKTEMLNGASTGTVTYEPGFLRFDTAWVGQAVDFESTEDYRRLEYDMGGALKSDTNNSHSFTIEAVDESLTVPAGTLDGCLRVRRQRVLAMGAAATDDDDKRYWFCPGVGKAKEETLSTGATEELVSCTIPGRACP